MTACNNSLAVHVPTMSSNCGSNTEPHVQEEWPLIQKRSAWILLCGVHLSLPHYNRRGWQTGAPNRDSLDCTRQPSALFVYAVWPTTEPKAIGLDLLEQFSTCESQLDKVTNHCIKSDRIWIMRDYQVHVMSFYGGHRNITDQL